MTSAAVYCRISEDRLGTGLGVERQEADCRRLCEARGWTVAEVLVDNDVSAYAGRQRPSYELLLELVREHRVEAIVAWHPDRLHRSPTELEGFIDLVESAGARVATVQGGEYDLATASGRMAARIVGAVARHESEQKSERIRRKHRELAERGRPAGGGPRPFGYVNARREEIVEKEAEVIRGAADLLLSGASKAEVVRFMRKHSTTAQGREWTMTRMVRLLDSAAIAGLRELHAKDPTRRELLSNEPAWPAVIDLDTHRRLRTILADRQRPRAASRYLLTGGLARCGLCGAPLVAQPRRDYRSYRCPQPGNTSGLTGCGSIRIKAEEFEDHVVEEALRWATSPDAIRDRALDRREVQGRERVLRDRLAQLGVREQNLTDLAVDGAIDPREYRRKVEELREERTRLGRELALVASVPPEVELGHLDEVRVRFGELTLNEQRARLRTLLTRVVVRPGVRGRNTFDPDRVEVWPSWAPLVESAETYARDHGLSLWTPDDASRAQSSQPPTGSRG